jgi:hypothetical protein
MKIRIDTLTARVDSEGLTKEQLSILLEKGYANWAKSPSGEVRWYANWEKFEGLTLSPKLYELFSGRFIDGKFRCPGNNFKWSGHEDMTDTDIKSESGLGINSERTWREYEINV